MMFYEVLWCDFQVVFDDFIVKLIMFFIDFLGGEVNGCDEFVIVIYEVCGIKLIIVYVFGMVVFGGYWIVFVVDRVVVFEFVIFGFIGVVFGVEDKMVVEEWCGVCNIQFVFF